MTDSGKNKAAQELGRKARQKRVESLSAERRGEIAKQAAERRWKNLCLAEQHFCRSRFFHCWAVSSKLAQGVTTSSIASSSSSLLVDKIADSGVPGPRKARAGSAG